MFDYEGACYFASFTGPKTPTSGSQEIEVESSVGPSAHLPLRKGAHGGLKVPSRHCSIAKSALNPTAFR